MKIEKIMEKIPSCSGANYALKRLDLEGCIGNSHDRLFGYPRNYLDNLGHYLVKADFLEKIISRNIVSQETRSGINYILALDIYPKLEKDMGEFLNKASYGWLYYESDKKSKLWALKDEYRKKYTQSKNSIKDESILKRFFQKEAENFDENNKKELVINYGLGNWGSPKNREVLTNAGNLWLTAGNHKKAEDYFKRAGPYEWVHAARMFEEAKDKKRAIKFWTLAAKNPTGYFEDRDRESAQCYEAIGELEKAIKCYESSAAGFRMQEGSYDLHGDLKPGIEAAETDEENVLRLRNKLKKIKGGIK